MSNTLEFLRFKPLSLLDKVRLGAGILYASKMQDWKRLEKIYVKTWLIRVFGRRNYEKMWEPLLRSKLGSAKDEASAALIWAIIKRYYGTRHSSSKTELMGCVKGGYFTILKFVSEHLLKNGTEILFNHGVEKITSLNGGRLRAQCQNGQALDFDRIVATTPNPAIIKMWANAPENVRRKLESVRYLNILCVTLLLKHSLTPFYVTNLTDMDLPFTGLIEATHVIPPGLLNGNALIYLPKYLPPGDPFYEETDEKVMETFIDALSRMFGDFSKSDIISHLVNRETFVQPIQEISYSEKILPMKTPLNNFYIVNTTMILNSTLNNNQVIQLAQKAADVVTQA
jgi:protoporphyrinogen oxidase